MVAFPDNLIDVHHIFGGIIKSSRKPCPYRDDTIDIRNSQTVVPEFTPYGMLLIYRGNGKGLTAVPLGISHATGMVSLNHKICGSTCLAKNASIHTNRFPWVELMERYTWNVSTRHLLGHQASGSSPVLLYQSGGHDSTSWFFSKA